MARNQIKELIFKYRVYLITTISVILSVSVYIITLSSNKSMANVLNVISLSMIPACIIGILWEAFIKQAFVQLIKEEFDFKDQLNKYGIKEIFIDRGEIRLISSIRDAKKRIWILLTSLNYLTETPGIQDQLIEKAKKRNFDLRILGLAPDTGIAKQRSAFSIAFGSLEEEIPIYKRKITTAFEANRDRVKSGQIGMYELFPTCACFFIDDLLFLCPLVCFKRGRECVHFLVSNNNENNLFKEYERHFEVLFEKAKIIFDSKSNDEVNCKK